MLSSEVLPDSTQIEALHKAGNIFNAILNADRKAVETLLRANPHVLSQRGPVGELPLHMCYLYNTPAHQVLAFYLMSLCPHVIAEQYTGTEYTVAFIGFLPGFPYMLRVPSLIAVPRRATPRVTVPAGSVGIAGHQTGIYKFRDLKQSGP